MRRELDGRRHGNERLMTLCDSESSLTSNAAAIAAAISRPEPGEWKGPANVVRALVLGSPRRLCTPGNTKPSLMSEKSTPSSERAAQCRVAALESGRTDRHVKTCLGLHLQAQARMLPPTRKGRMGQCLCATAGARGASCSHG